MKRLLILAVAVLAAMCLSGCAVIPYAVDVLQEIIGTEETKEIRETPKPTPEHEPEQWQEAEKVEAQPVATLAPTEAAPETVETPIPEKTEFVYNAELAVYSIAHESYVRSANGDAGHTNTLGADEYFTPVLNVEYYGADPLTWQEMYVTLDDGEHWGWSAGELASGSSMLLHIYHSNMKNVGEGQHTARWYIDGREVWSYTFTLQQDFNWEQLTQLPTQAEIDAHNVSATLRSPYIAAWLDVPGDVNYSEYQIDFKSDHAPRGSYFAIGNFMMDYSALQKQYKKVYTEYGITGYAGFQNIYNGKKICIMSVWDTYCEDSAGNVTVVRATPVYPQDAYKSGEFGGEGVGAQCLVEYDWKKNRWYRATLKAYDGDNGNTQLEFWVMDLETGEQTLICAYDLGVGGVTFRGDNCIFLENYLPEYSGDIRTMEIKNAKVLETESGRWRSVNEGNVYPNSGALDTSYQGSFDYGVEKDRLWIMTTGVGDREDTSAGKHVRMGD